MESHTLSPRRQLYDKGLRVVLYFCGFLTCALLVLIIGYIFYRGVPFISWELLSTAPSYLEERIGILPDILNTLYLVMATILFVLPLGVCAAIYLNEYASNKKLVAAIEYAAETLSGIPSIIYGLVGMLIFCKNGTSLIAGAWTLTIMNLPTVMRTTQESLKTVPQSYREGAFGLGAGKGWLHNVGAADTDLVFALVSEEWGLLLAVRVDGIELAGRELGPLLVALSPTPVSDGGAYRVLVGAE